MRKIWHKYSEVKPGSEGYYVTLTSKGAIYTTRYIIKQSVQYFGTDTLEPSEDGTSVNVVSDVIAWAYLEDALSDAIDDSSIFDIVLNGFVWRHRGV